MTNSDCVRAAQVNPRESEDTEMPSGVVRTRAIPLDDRVAQAKLAITQAMTHNVKEPTQGLGSGWLHTEQPPALSEILRTIRPEDQTGIKWITGTVSGIYRAAVFGACILIMIAVSDRNRAGVALLITATTVGVGWVVTEIH